MNYKDLERHFGGPTAIGDALDTPKQNVNAWKTARIPSKWQLKAERLSAGKLRADKQARRDAEEMALYVA